MVLGEGFADGLSFDFIGLMLIRSSFDSIGIPLCFILLEVSSVQCGPTINGPKRFRLDYCCVNPMYW
jgi:hypothetical protein